MSVFGWLLEAGDGVICVVLVLTVCVSQEDTIGDLKKLIAAQTGTRWDKIVLKKW